MIDFESPEYKKYKEAGREIIVQKRAELAAEVEKLEKFVVKDSGERQEFASGMRRDVTMNKADYSLVFDGPMLERYAEHLTKGAAKYAPRNWMMAASPAELDRFRQSAARHFAQWMRGDTDEDHAAAVWFNINGYEYTKGRQFVDIDTP